MTTPDEDRLEEVDDTIRSARRQAEEHGTIEGEHPQRFNEEGAADKDEYTDDGIAPQGLIP